MITGILRRLGPIGRRIAWDREFRGEPSFVGERSAAMVRLCGAFDPSIKVVELACGDGSLAEVLSLRYADYTGFDISAVAVEAAKRKAPSAQFHVSSMEDWKPDGLFDLLIIEEAMYYLSPADQRAILRRAFDAGARVLITVHDAAKHAKTIENCKAESFLIGEFSENARSFLVLERPPGTYRHNIANYTDAR